MPTNYLDFELMEKMCHRLAVAIFDTNDDPIAGFEDHKFELLDSALQLPRQTFDGGELYPTLEQKAAALYYTLNKNHPFTNGNKRIATASLLVFLYINDSWLNVPRENLLARTLDIAKSDPKDREIIVKDLNDWIGENIKREVKD